MLDSKDFSFFENTNSFDFKGFLIKTASYWKWFLVSLAIAFTIAYQDNIRKEPIYAMETTIAIKEESNPFFTSNTSLVFNWGGTSDQVQGISSTIRSRSHNELVVDRLNFFVEYLSQDKYFTRDVYGEAPFYIVPDKTRGQIKERLISIKFVTPTEYEVRHTFDTPTVPVTFYNGEKGSRVKVAQGDFVKKYKVGQEVRL